MEEPIIQNLDNVKQLASHDLKKENVLQVLDWEIERAVAENTQPGWTTWAIYGALSAVIWTLLVQLDSSTVSIDRVLYYFLIAQLSQDFMKHLPTIIAPHRLNQRRPNRFIFSNILASNRYQMVAESARALLLLLIAKYYSSVVPATFTYLVYLYYGIAIFISLCALVASYIKWPIPIPSSGNPAIWIIPTLSATFVMIPLLGYLFKIGPDSISIIDIKIAALLAAAAFLVLALIEKKIENPLLSSLIDIRRNLSFGHMALDDAIKQADIAIAGMQVRDVLQDDIKNIISSFEKISLDADQIESLMQEVLKQWPIKLCDMTDKTRIYISKETNQALLEYKKIEILAKQNEERLKKFKKKIEWLVALMRQQPQEIIEIVSLLDKAENDSKQRFTRNISTILDLMKKVDQPCEHFKENALNAECSKIAGRSD